MYTNEKIKRLIEERKSIIEKYDAEIREEIEREKAKYKFSWKRFLLMVLCVFVLFTLVEVNKKIFPPTSIWSWKYYIK